MDVLVFVFILVGTMICSAASDTHKIIDNEFDGSLTSGVVTSATHSPNFSHPILEMEKKKHLLFVLEEAEQDETYLRVDQNSGPANENQRNEGQRFHYSSSLEDQLQMVPSSEDQQLVNGTDGGPQHPSVAHTNHYVIPILLCLGLLLALLILFTQYFKWTDNGNYHVT